MEIYLKPILTACYTFPFIAAVFTLPYILRQYQKYGALLLLRVGIVYTFIFYMMTSYFMTILPLPPIESVHPSSATVLLIPFDAVRRLAASSGFQITDPATYLPTLRCMDFWQIAFNILLLVPFGVYLRYYFKRRWYQVLILSFLYSLFFELTQLSGLYGIYPYPYRFFEVDDLICNTLGGVLGFIITPALAFFLPKREQLDEKSYKKGTHVTAYRRLIAFLIDYTIIGIIYILISRLAPYSYRYDSYIRTLILPVTAFLYYTILMLATRGYTIGKKLVNIRIVRSDNQKAPWYMLLLRSFLLNLIALPAPLYIVIIIHTIDLNPAYPVQVAITLIMVFFAGIALYYVENVLFSFVKRKVIFSYDRICHLQTISTVTMKTSDNQENIQQQDNEKKEI